MSLYRVIYEFNISNLISNIKQFISKLIETATEKLKSTKDKVAERLRKIIDKLKSLFKKSDDIKSEKDYQDISNEANKMKDQVKHPEFSEDFINAVYENNVRRVHIMIGDAYLLNKDNVKVVDDMIAFDISINGVNDSKYNIDDIIKVWNMENITKSEAEDKLNELLVMFKQDDGYSSNIRTRIERLLKKI